MTSILWFVLLSMTRRIMRRGENSTCDTEDSVIGSKGREKQEKRENCDRSFCTGIYTASDKCSVAQIGSGHTKLLPCVVSVIVHATV